MKQNTSIFNAFHIKPSLMAAALTEEAEEMINACPATDFFTSTKRLSVPCVDAKPSKSEILL